MPARLALRQNAPNPFSSGTALTFDVPSPGADVRLEVFDVAGRRVCVLLDGAQPPGRRAVHWDGQDSTGRRVASGIYYCRMVADGFEQTVKMMLLR
jgi:flagellar hook assembly protein FlgD